MSTFPRSRSRSLLFSSRTMRIAATCSLFKGALETVSLLFTGEEGKTSAMEKQHAEHDQPSRSILSTRTKQRIPSLELLPISRRTSNDENDNDDDGDGVRELSDDEDGLREINEDEMNETDEFFLFPQTKANLNRLYTFTKPNDQQQQHAPYSSPRDLSLVDQVSLSKDLSCRPSSM